MNNYLPARGLRPPRKAPLPVGWRPHHVYAIRYATRPSAVRAEHFYGHDPRGGETMPIDYFVWLITGPDAAILVDAGYTEQTAFERGSRQHLGSPLDVAAALGYPISRIPSIVLTHCHYDHTGYLAELPEALIHVQQREIAFWIGPDARRAMYSTMVLHQDLTNLVTANLNGGLEQLDGDAQIADGVSVHLVGGHTPGTQCVRIELGDGYIVVLASDASHFFENIEAQRPFGIAHTVPHMLDAFDRIHELASDNGVIVPGHDPLVKERFPAEPIDGYEGRVWRLA